MPAKMPLRQAVIHDRARAALKEAQRLLPGWRAAARMLSKNSKMTVKLGAGGTACTDGKVIYLRVPPELAEMPKHDTALCGVRGSDSVQSCEACALVEDVNITIIHEIAHAVFDTFEEVSPHELASLLQNAIRINPGKDAEKLRRSLEALDARQRADYLNLSNAVSPFLPGLINACEDIRVNALMQKERPGTRVMFDAQTQIVFNRGLQDYDGTIKRWSEQPPNAQAMIGVYCKTGGFNYENWLDPRVVEALDDPELDHLCNKMRDAKSIRTIYNLSIPLLECLRRLGFMRDDEDEPDDPGEGMEGDDGEASDESGEGDAEEDGSSDADSSEGGDEAPDSDDDGGGDSTEEQDDPSDPSEGDGSGDEDASDDSSEDSDGDGGSEDSSGGLGDREDSSGDDGAGESDGESASDGPVDAPTSPQDGPQDGAPVEGPDSPTDGSQDDPSGPPDAGKENGEPAFQPDEDEDMGSAEDVEHVFVNFGRHEESQSTTSGKVEQSYFEDALEVAIDQMKFFDSPSLNIDGVAEHQYGEGHRAWEGSRYYQPVDLKLDEGMMSVALHRLRLMFTDNARGRVERNRRTGKVDGRVLAKRAPVGDDRLFRKNIKPGRRDYFVLIGLDISGSTSAPIGDGQYRLTMMQKAAGAKAELLSRLGIKFAMYAHSGSDGKLDIFEVKGPQTPWGPKTREALANLKPYSGNLDGHTMEYYRKVIERRHETDRLLLYYTDGAMPAANYDEELLILQREIKKCRELDIHLVGIGVQSDAPREHGLDTILLDSLEDIPNVVNELRKRLV